MVRIFHVITNFDLGGSERVAINIAKSKCLDFEVHMFEVVRGKSDFSMSMIKELETSNIVCHRSFVNHRKLAILVFPLTLLIHSLKLHPSIIHSHTEIPDLSCYLFSKIAGLINIKPQYIRTIHNTELWTSWKRIGKVVEKFFIRKNANVAISEATKRNYVNNYKMVNIPIIYNGIGTSFQNSFPDLSEGKINILFAGRFEFQKGIDELIEVVSALKDDTRYHFIIVGSGTLEPKIQKTLGQLTNTTILKKIFNLDKYLSSFDYLFMPSNFEGLPLLAIEASLNKVPCIINNCKGLNETLPLDWPLKVDHNSVQDFLFLFKNIIGGVQRSKLGERAHDFARTRFTIETMQDKYTALYKEKLMF